MERGDNQYVIEDLTNSINQLDWILVEHLSQLLQNQSCQEQQQQRKNRATVKSGFPDENNYSGSC